ncbi:dihydrodipicolinate synthase family protein [Thermoactinomyces sp. CICC 10522]|uniref:dihydrodipicolinate synthase family protein n=1 Tax=Thermoactinomyces sp. CICC 10522 TaxID=2767427 RepID=UPI0018DD3B96|nr:dihydrodipicolinate synthase family protein [Thermoactinomyces sp. CICC 10522]MBH8604503.1 dihydrodipicolinate synthase family protein [Thermoactinomyces sp. CICC 10522]
MNSGKECRPEIKDALHEGVVIPAHPLALNRSRQLDEQRQRALTRYYMAAGAGGIAVAVHTTQFEIREHHLLEPVLRLAAEEVEHAGLNRPFIKVAGICGPDDQALREAELAAGLGYDLGLLSVNGLQELSEEKLIQRAEKVAEIIPVFGFYLQPSVGGRYLSFDFWKAFADIPGVMAIKIAPFNRYQTLDVVRAVCHAKRCEEIALYTGNDDNIVADLLTTYRFRVNGKWTEKKIAGGLLGHWAIWTKKAVELFEEIKSIRDNRQPIPPRLLELAVQITDCNAAFFDSANRFAGCIAGIHEVLRRQGLLEGRWCLNPDEVLSPGQLEEIDRVYREYPHLNDDAFIARHKEQWLSPRSRNNGSGA